MRGEVNGLLGGDGAGVTCCNTGGVAWRCVTRRGSEGERECGQTLPGRLQNL